ncbi:MAG: hypothetical protein IJ620_01090 [Bacteroidales bacterium]|nr:hypothetical protein [Bacteroidales bacterium]
MELIVYVLILFIVLSCLFKLSVWKWWQCVIYSILLSIFAWWSVDFAVVQTKTQMADFLQNTEALQSVAILITIESAVGIAYALSFLNGTSHRGFWSRMVAGVMKFYPSLLMFPVVFYLLTQTVFVAVGVPFQTIGMLFALAIVVLIPLLSSAVRWLLPDETWRVELYFMLVISVCILGLVATQNGRMVYAVSEAPIEWGSLVSTLALFMTMAFVGWLYFMVRHHRRRH